VTEFGHEEPAFLSVAETARRLGVPERTLRRYLDRHGPYLPIRRNGRAVMVEVSALPTLATIRDAYRRGLSAEQVEAELRDAGKPITIETVPAEALISPAAEALSRLVEAVTGLQAELRQTREELAATRRAMERMLEMQEQRHQPAEEGRKGLVARLKRILTRGK